VDVTSTGSTDRVTELGMPTVGPLQRLAPNPARDIQNMGRK
jgi:hypothetical protein